VKGRDYGTTSTLKIMGVTVRADNNGAESISLTLQTL